MVRRGLAVVGVLLAAVVAAAWWEMRTSTLQAWYFARMVSDVGYEVREGPSPRIVFPEAGPWDERLGYVRLPELLDGLTGAGGFRIVEQAQVTRSFQEVVENGLYPLYAEKPAGGLTLLDRRGEVVHRSLHPLRAYASFDSIPEILWRSLLWIENRDFLDPERPKRNPAVEWDRLARAVFEMGMRAVGSERNIPGGSTLATQLEKFRHSPDGRTRSLRDKLRQMATASARAYLDGPETLEHQRRIVRDYLNTVPLAAQRGHGEVVGTADGLWAWFGTPFDEANRLLRGRDVAPEELPRQGQVFRQALSLLVAHRRPSYYLVQAEGRAELPELTHRHLSLLREAGVVPEALAAAAAAPVDPLPRAPERPPVSFVERKAASQLRAHLLHLLGLPSVYDLDRTDATVRATLDLVWQTASSELFLSLADPGFVRDRGFGADRMLDRGDPARVLYSFTLLETTPVGNAIRAQADNYEGPLSLNDGGRLELGSTAKLRTLVTYLQATAELHRRLAGLPADSLEAVRIAERDRLGRWSVDWLRRNPGGELRAMLDAAMARTYSASPAERFATGGGVQTFSNFDATWDGRVMTVHEAFRHSVNLPFIRVMRDVVDHFIYGGAESTANVLEDDELRQEYLSRFADEEGSRFVARFHRKYSELAGPEIFEELVRERNLTPQRTAWAFRSVAPDADLERFGTLLRDHTPHATLTGDAVQSLFETADPSRWDLNDLGFLARIHPLELWVARHHLETPEAELDEALAESRDVRQEVYRWLFRTRRRNAQDRRIRTMLEIEAFERIHQTWRSLGYPFRNIVPSYGTAIGSSGDTPLALAELMGIIVNDGVRYPVVRIEGMRFAAGTPFETALTREAAEGEQVLEPEVARVVREALADVVENGTARRMREAVTDATGTPVPAGAKTGTGDNRMRIYGSGGQLVESRVINRTATVVFFLGDRHFGVVTAYVEGPDAGGFRFTSGLPSQIVRTLGASLSPLDPVAVRYEGPEEGPAEPPSGAPPPGDPD